MIMEVTQNDQINNSDDCNGENDRNSYLKYMLLDGVAHSSAHFKSQQIGEPDLTFLEKRCIAEELLNKGPAFFLARFSQHITPEGLKYFDQFKGNYEVDFYLRDMQKTLDERQNKMMIKNRRYNALKKMVMEGQYFSDQEMKKRNPLLFDHMIGQYMTDEEKAAAEKIDMTDLRFTTILLEHIERDHVSSLRRQQQEQEDDMFEESDSDDDGDEAYSTSNEKEDHIMDDGDNGLSHPSAHHLSQEEKQLLREEFLTSMHQSFLKGKDKEFDYSTVDNNTDYDDLNQLEKDEEEKYFDSEEPEESHIDDISTC